MSRYLWRAWEAYLAFWRWLFVDRWWNFMETWAKDPMATWAWRQRQAWERSNPRRPDPDETWEQATARFNREAEENRKSFGAHHRHVYYVRYGFCTAVLALSTTLILVPPVALVVGSWLGSAWLVFWMLGVV